MDEAGAIRDILVLGGGPAGCAAAIHCAQRGLKVTLLEAKAFPRHRPGETLHPGVEPVLGQLGVVERVLAAKFPRHEGNWIEWGVQPLRFESVRWRDSAPSIHSSRPPDSRQLDASAKVYFPMKRTVKAAVLLVCLSLCALGLILSPKGDAGGFSPETELLPVENPQPSRGVGLRV